MDFDMETECMLCGGCADICPVDCIQIMSFKNLIFSENSHQLITDRCRFDSDIPVDRRMMLIKNEDDCIRCGLCVKQCPVGVMTMVDDE